MKLKQGGVGRGEMEEEERKDRSCSYCGLHDLVPDFPKQIVTLQLKGEEGKMSNIVGTLVARCPPE